MGAYTNGNTVSKLIQVQGIRTSGDDTLSVYGDIGSCLKITEVSYYID